MIRGAGPICTQADAIHAVDRFMTTELQARALGLALSRGLVDLLVGRPGLLEDDARRQTDLPANSFALLLDLLKQADIVEGEEALSLTERFGEVLRFRDLLEAKLWFAQTAAADVHEHFELLLSDIPAFMGQAKTFELFRYDRCFEVTPENVAATRRWVSYTTTLTKYEGPSCWERIDLAGRRHLLDLGGNSGEFARQACSRSASLKATVIDLPVVCALGREHLSATAEAGRVAFSPGDLRAMRLPDGHDLISFKSVLHDWPDEDAALFLDKAAAALSPGGQIVIFERGQIPAGASMDYAMVANLVFLPFFRNPRFYADRLRAAGLVDIAIEPVDLDMHFHLLTARKP